jgi:RHS repeat-associated protein
LSYDSAGDLQNDGVNTYTYDAEGRVATVNGTTTYVYDAEGRRVAKESSGAVTASYEFDQGGREIAVVNGSGQWQYSNLYAGAASFATYDAAGTRFQLVDALGSRRVQGHTDGTAGLNCFNYPFGDGLSCTGPDEDATKLHFTGKERDSETGFANGNDNFGARYYGAGLGRFLTPDWAARPTAVPYAVFGDPQSLNLYAYVRNDPVTHVDADGHAANDPANTGCVADANGCVSQHNTQEGNKQTTAEQDVASDKNAAQQQAPAPQGADPTVTLNLGGTSVKVDYTYGPMNSPIYQGGVDITATPSGCSGCSWGQVIGREGDQSQPVHKDGKEIGPLYGQEGGPANQLKDRPASFNGVSQTVTATSVLGGVSGHTFSPKGAMTWGYSINGKGGVSMIGPRVATPGEYKNAVTILRNASAGTGWQVQ